MSKIPKITGFKKAIHVTKNIAIAITIIGFALKYCSIKGGIFLLSYGLLGLAAVFILSSMIIPKEESFEDYTNLDQNKNDKT